MDNMRKRNNEQEYMRRTAIGCIIEQLKLRGEDVIKADKFDRHDLYIKDKDINLRVKFCKPIKRAGNPKYFWEFTKVMHSLRLWPKNVFDYYILVGFSEDMVIKKIWKIAADDELIYRKNQIFIPVDNTDGFDDYELKILENPTNENFEWVN